ncbi:MAG: hypothetical protein L0G99_09625 [Propionibacteriales bacterium]|nr:hypothetical protein [Propionibacteriales bacterium]
MKPDDLTLAFELAADATAIAMSWSGGEVPHTLKEDGSPVTEGDLEVNHALVEVLAESRPDDGVLSEEVPEITGTSGRRWIIDPIDGTRSFMKGRPGWGTHIALEADGEIVLGMITRPEDDQIFWAVRGTGAFRAPLETPQDQSHRLHLSSGADLAAATVSGYGDMGDPDLAILAMATTFERRVISPIPDFLNGDLDALLLIGGKVWDFAPLVPLVREAGGDIRSRDGGSALDENWLLCSNAGLVEPLSALYA